MSPPRASPYEVSSSRQVGLAEASPSLQLLPRSASNSTSLHCRVQPVAIPDPAALMFLHRGRSCDPSVEPGRPYSEVPLPSRSLSMDSRVAAPGGEERPEEDTGGPLTGGSERRSAGRYTGRAHSQGGAFCGSPQFEDMTEGGDGGCCSGANGSRKSSPETNTPPLAAWDWSGRRRSASRESECDALPAISFGPQQNLSPRSEKRLQADAFARFAVGDVVYVRCNRVKWHSAVVVRVDPEGVKIWVSAVNSRVDVPLQIVSTHLVREDDAEAMLRLRIKSERAAGGTDRAAAAAAASSRSGEVSRASGARDGGAAAAAAEAGLPSPSAYPASGGYGGGGAHISLSRESSGDWAQDGSDAQGLLVCSPVRVHAVRPAHLSHRHLYKQVTFLGGCCTCGDPSKDAPLSRFECGHWAHLACTRSLQDDLQECPLCSVRRRIPRRSLDSTTLVASQRSSHSGPLLGREVFSERPEGDGGGVAPAASQRRNTRRRSSFSGPPPSGRRSSLDGASGAGAWGVAASPKSTAASPNSGPGGAHKSDVLIGSGGHGLGGQSISRASSGSSPDFLEMQAPPRGGTAARASPSPSGSSGSSALMSPSSVLPGLQLRPQPMQQQERGAAAAAAPQKLPGLVLPAAAAAAAAAAADMDGHAGGGGGSAFSLWNSREAGPWISVRKDGQALSGGAAAKGAGAPAGRPPMDTCCGVVPATGLVSVS